MKVRFASPVTQIMGRAACYDRTPHRKSKLTIEEIMASAQRRYLNLLKQADSAQARHRDRATTL